MSADNELTFYRCPVCGGGIQATREEYLVDTTLDEKGSVMDDGGDPTNSWGKIIAYCENDHTHEEMINCINGEIPIHPDVTERSPWDA